MKEQYMINSAVILYKNKGKCYGLDLECGKCIVRAITKTGCGSADFDIHLQIATDYLKTVDPALVLEHLL